MAEKVSYISDVLDGNFVDCFVSTDSYEVAELLASLGYNERRDGDIPEENNLLPASCMEIDGSLGYAKLIKNNLKIDCVDILLEDAIKMKNDIGFMSMSKFRIYTNSSKNASYVTTEISRKIGGKLQNMAFFNGTYSKVCICQWESFC